MLASHPEGKSWHSYTKSPIRYISRLDNFPYSDVTQKDENKRDQNLRQNLKRFRGVLDGKASGIGATPEGHHVKTLHSGLSITL